MRQIDIGAHSATGGAAFIASDARGATFLLPREHGGISVPGLVGCRERYLTFYAEADADHSVALRLCFYVADQPEAAFYVTFGLLPRIRALVCMDLAWIEGKTVFPERNPGQVKLVCLGEHIAMRDVTRVTIENSPCFAEVPLWLAALCLTDDAPEAYPIPDVKLIDAFGQYKLKDWPGKIQSEEMLRARVTAMAGAPGTAAVFPMADWRPQYGSSARIKLTEGTGFFTKTKQRGRWWLADPDGYAFFSVGVDVICPQIDCRIDGVEKWLDWLPAQDDPVYGQFFRRAQSAHSERMYTTFDYEKLNLYRVFGENWYERWLDFMPRRLKGAGINTIANWSDGTLQAASQMVYVDQLPRFPSTKQCIFRDFPDVLSPEYAQSAAACAEYLRPRAHDPRMIGYFLRNEPHWAFADNLIIADELLRCEAPTCCKDALIRWLADKYGTIAALNAAWRQAFPSFEALQTPVTGKPSAYSAQAHEDMRAFSRILLFEYAAVPSAACRRVDPNHMILGMRWAWIKDPDIVTGWENFDVFSINCYQPDPVPSVDRAVAAGVDLPILVGEFQFGALDRGPTATGLSGVRTQQGRARAYRRYCERLAAHPNGVGCHYFQCYDQFALGRFDGENYNIGLFDLCSQPYEELTAAFLASSTVLYGVMEGSIPPYDAEEADYIPMIAY